MVTDKAKPPVCKIADFGKYLYQLQKKEKGQPISRTGEIKGIRLTFNISDHDLGTRVKQACKFLKKGYKVRVEMKLRGREKRLVNFSRNKVKKFLDDLAKETPIKTERELRKKARGLTIIISKDMSEDISKDTKENENKKINSQKI